MGEKSESNLSIPKKCPKIETCTEKILDFHYQSICCTYEWLHCSNVKQEGKEKYKKTPSEWKKGDY